MYDCVSAVRNCPDLIQYASQWGRFDLVTILLAIVTIAFVVAAVDVRNTARRKAKKEAEKVTEKYLEQNLEGLLSEYLDKTYPLWRDIYVKMSSLEISDVPIETASSINEKRDNSDDVQE